MASASLLTFKAKAQQIIWTGMASSDWSDGGNWSTLINPTSSDTVFINGGTSNAPVIGVGGAQAGTLYIGSTIGGFGIGTGIGSLTTSMDAGNVSIADALVVGEGAGANGSITVNSGNWSVRGDLRLGTAGGTGTIIFGDITVESYHPFEINGQTTIGDGAGSNGTLIINNSDLNAYPFDGSSTKIGINGGVGILTVNSAHDYSYPIASAYFGDSVWGDGVNSNAIITSDGGRIRTDALTAGTNSGTANINLMASGKTNRDSSSNLSSMTFLLGGSGGSGNLTISDNGSMDAYSSATIGQGTGSIANVNILSGGKMVLGSGSHNNDPTPTIAQDGANSAINISGVGSFGQQSGLTSNSGLSIGQGAGSVGTINVLASGKLATFSGYTWQFSEPHTTVLGIDGGTGNVNVSGSGAVWYVASDPDGSSQGDPAQYPPADLHVGYSGNGNVTIANGGVVSVGWAEADGDWAIVASGGIGTVYVAELAGSSGSVTIGGAVGSAPEASGTLLAAGIQFGAGNGSLNFNVTDTNHQFTIPVSGHGTIANYAGTTWLAADNSGFSGATNLYGGTLGLDNDNSIGSSAISVLGNATLAYNNGINVANTIDIKDANTLSAFVTDGFSATQNGLISGTGNLTKVGGGTLFLTGTNTYAGKTTVSDGVLALTGTGSISQSRVVQVDSIFDITGVTTGSSAIRSLSGGGSVLLGGNDLVLTAANDLFSGVISGNGGLQVTGGTETLSGANSYLGGTFVANGTLCAGAVNTFSPSSAVTVAAGGTLDLNGFSQAIAGLNNGGTVRFGNSTPPQTVLTVNGNYVGNGGMLIMNTALGDDNAPTDRMLISGVGHTATGTTLVTIIDVNGSGAQTTGNGIPIIIGVDGGSTAGAAFLQAGRLAAGAYDYHLYQNGIGADSGDGNWYLRSTLIPTGGGGEVPDYRPEVPLAASIPPIATEYGYAMLGTLHERVGEGYNRPAEPRYDERIVHGRNGKEQVVRTLAHPGTGGDTWFGGAWGRIIGDRGLRDRNGNLLVAGPNYSYTFGGIQAGLDLWGRDGANGTDRAGLYVGYGTIDANVKGAYGGRAGSVDMDATTIGAYWTHKAAQGWYTDAVIQGTWYSTDATSVYGQKLKPDGFGFVASLEGGYAFNLGNGFTIEPQAQLAYQNMSFDKFSDAYGRFSIDDGDSLRGRIGVRVTKTWNNGTASDPRLITLWGRANVWHEFMGNGKTTTTSLAGLNAVIVPSNLGGTWGEVGAGVTAQLNRNLSLFATGAYQHSLDGKGREGWNGRLGLNVKW